MYKTKLLIMITSNLNINISNFNNILILTKLSMKRILMILFALITIQFIVSFSANADELPQINKIFIERKEVFDSSRDGNWFFAASIANFFHSTTKEYLVEDELLFSANESFTESMLQETERNLRATGLFSYVKIELDSVGFDKYNAYVVTRDRWSLRPSVKFDFGGNNRTLGGKIEELNLFGTGTRLNFEAINTSELDIGWKSTFEFNHKRLFRSDVGVDFKLFADQYRTEQYLKVAQPFRSLASKYSYGVNLTNKFGSDFLFSDTPAYSLMGFHERRAEVWFGRSWKPDDAANTSKNSRVFFTVYGEYEDIDRASPDYRRALDNSGKVLLAFSSVSEKYYQTKMLNGYLTEDICEGGYGSAIIGKIFPIGSKGESLYYVAGQGELSYYRKDIYLFGQVSGASAFTRSSPFYTYQEFTGLGFYRISDKFLLAARLRQQNVWNWYAIRQLVLDNKTGLRGYQLNEIVGDNRIISNIEFRFFPDIPVWIFNLSGTAFWDCGSAWRQDFAIDKTRWHHSLGFGIRIHDMKSSGTKGIFRIDFAFNMDEKRFGEIILTSDQLFSVFQKHEYKLPEIYGMEFDTE